METGKALIPPSSEGELVLPKPCFVVGLLESQTSRVLVRLKDKYLESKDALDRHGSGAQGIIDRRRVCTFSVYSLTGVIVSILQ